MHYAVTWDLQCFAQLETIADAGADFNELKQAVRFVDQALSFQPTGKGELLSEGLRKLNLAPLRVYFHVDEPNATVVVDAVAWIGTAQ
jgi:hypothetical protein